MTFESGDFFPRLLYTLFNHKALCFCVLPSISRTAFCINLKHDLGGTFSGLYKIVFTNKLLLFYSVSAVFSLLYAYPCWELLDSFDEKGVSAEW